MSRRKGYLPYGCFEGRPTPIGVCAQCGRKAAKHRPIQTFVIKFWRAEGNDAAREWSGLFEICARCEPEIRQHEDTIRIRLNSDWLADLELRRGLEILNG